jgi:hypothetical protein
MRLLVSIFLYGFLLDAVLSVANEWLPITPFRAIVAWTVFAAGLVLYALTAFVPRLPKRLVLPPAIFLVWTNICGAFPLAFIAPGHALPALECSQLILAIALLLLHRRWSHTPPEIEPTAFSWRSFALITLLTVAAIPFVLAAAAVNTAAAYIEARTDGYVKLRPAGLVLEERELTRDGKHVRLVSMMHIGEKNFYDHIYASMPTAGTAVVLLEGVTDHQGLLKNRFSYSKIAELFNLTSQETSELQHGGNPNAGNKPNSNPAAKPTVKYRQADVDISTFAPLTLEFINAIGVILANPTAETISHTFRDPASPLQQPDADKIVMRDILEKRNEHLVSEIDRALQTSQTVVVPWGALHLPYIETALKEEGFREASRVERPIIRFWRTSDAAAK